MHERPRTTGQLARRPTSTQRRRRPNSRTPRRATSARVGRVTELLKALAALPVDEKKLPRREINPGQGAHRGRAAARRDRSAEAELRLSCAAESLDVTLARPPARHRRPAPGEPHDRAHRGDLRLDGLRRCRRPEIETDWMSFTALNNPENHPARSMQDTFYVDLKDAEGRWLNLRRTPARCRSAMRAHAAKHAGTTRCPRSASSRRAAPTASTATPRTRRCSTSAKACGSARTSASRT
jgi:phenylalanyl-tRNA synthetase alpha subunit